MNNFKQFFLVGSTVFIVDQATKFLATIYGFQVSYNSGVTLSFLSQIHNTILTIFLIALVLVLFSFFRTTWQKNQLGAGLFFGGAVANIFDRILFGSVRDWILIPATQIQNNIADIAIFLSVVIISVAVVTEKKLTSRVK